jgi:hypothetical protein
VFPSKFEWICERRIFKGCSCDIHDGRDGCHERIKRIVTSRGPSVAAVFHGTSFGASR